MFNNYGKYAKDIFNAAKHMPKQKELKLSKFVGGVAASLIMTGLALNVGTSTYAYAEIQTAIQAVSGDLDNQKIIVEVNDDSDNSLASMLSDMPNNLSPRDEASIAEAIKGSITQDVLDKAAGKFGENGTLEIELTTDDNIPVIVTVKKDGNTYTIEKVVAKLDKQQIVEKKKEVKSGITTDEVKSKYMIDLNDYENGFDGVVGITSNTSADDEKQILDKQMTVLADNLVMAIPPDYKSQEINETTIADDPIPMAQTPLNEIPEEKLQADKIDPYVYSYKDEKGSVLSIRSENLGPAFTSMNGFEGVNKMKDYWQETAKSVSAGANQTFKGGVENGFTTEVFYDKESGMWGYFGHVEFSDGTRDVIYNRVVFVDELADQLITISYRHDSTVDAGSALSYDNFKKLIYHAPVDKTSLNSVSKANSAVGFNGGVNSVMATPVDITAGSVVGKSYLTATEIYKAKLYQIQILPGQTMTEPKRIAAFETKTALEAKKLEEAQVSSEASGSSAE